MSTNIPTKAKWLIPAGVSRTCATRRRPVQPKATGRLRLPAGLLIGACDDRVGARETPRQNSASEPPENIPRRRAGDKIDSAAGRGQNVAMLTRNRFDILRHLVGIELRQEEFQRRLAAAALLGKEGVGASIYFNTTVMKLVELGLIVIRERKRGMYVRLTNRGLQTWRKSR